MNYTTEGCFCPDGMKLFNKESGICVDKCGKCVVYSEIFCRAESIVLIIK